MNVIQLLAPVFIPSWRFFDEVGSSPRIEIGFGEIQDEPPTVWMEFRSISKDISIKDYIIRMIWNPVRNQDLFLMTCAQKVLEEQKQCYIDQIKRIISASKAVQSQCRHEDRFLYFRLVYLFSDDEDLSKEIGYISDAIKIPQNASER